MTTMVEANVDVPVRKSITVNATVERAFEVFTAEFDSWWPRSHHIGSSPMRKAIIEGKAGGRCYAEQEDDTESDWGRVLLWEPPRRFVFAWLINAEWQYEPDSTKTSEVEVRFTAQPDGSTRVDLEHRRFDRMGPAGESMREGVEAPSGWGDLLAIFAAQVEGRLTD